MNGFIGRLTLPGFFPSSTSCRLVSADRFTYASILIIGTWVQVLVNSLKGFSNLAILCALTFFSFLTFLAFGLGDTARLVSFGDGFKDRIAPLIACPLLVRLKFSGGKIAGGSGQGSWLPYPYYNGQLTFWVTHPGFLQAAGQLKLAQNERSFASCHTANFPVHC